MYDLFTLTEFKENLISFTSFSWKVGRAGRVDEEVEVEVEVDGKTEGVGEGGGKREVQGNKVGAGTRVGEGLI